MINAFGQNEESQTSLKENNLGIKAETSFPFYAGIGSGFIRYTFQGTGYYNQLENYMNERYFMNLSGNFLFGYNISDRWSLETGIQIQTFKEWHYYNTESMRSVSSSTGPSNYLTIPIQSMYRFKLFNNKFEIKPYAGISLYVLTINPGEYESGTEISFRNQYDENNTIISTDTLYTITSTSNYDNQVSLVANLGLRLEYAIFPRLSIFTSGNLAFGFNDINRLAIKVEEPENTFYGDIIANGSGYSLNAGLKYNFGR